jgi:hypothetical protein
VTFVAYAALRGQSSGLAADHLGRNREFDGGTAVKEYRDEAMKHLEAAERALPGEPRDAVLSSYEVNVAIASSLVAIAETLHAIRASLDKLAA